MQSLTESLDSEVGKLKIIQCKELDAFKSAFINDLNKLHKDFELKWKEVQSVQEDRIKMMEEQLNTLLEIHNCQRLMLEDNSAYIKKLEEKKSENDQINVNGKAT